MAKWTATHIPAANAQATQTQAGVVGKQHRLQGLTASLSLSGGTAADGLALQVLDGSTVKLSLPLETDHIIVIDFGEDGFPISDGADLVVRFSDAGGASTREAVTFWGKTC